MNRHQLALLVAGILTFAAGLLAGVEIALLTMCEGNTPLTGPWHLDVATFPVAENALLPVAESAPLKRSARPAHEIALLLNRKHVTVLPLAD